MNKRLTLVSNLFATKDQSDMTSQNLPSRNDFDPIAVAVQIWQAKVWLILFTCTCLGLTLLYLDRVKTALYQSSASVAFVPSTGMMQTADTRRIRDLGAAFSTNTEMGVLTSRGMLRELVIKLGLQDDVELLRNEPASLDAAVDGLRDMLVAKNVRFSFIVSLTVTSVDPDKSQRITNALVDLYLTRQLSDQVKAEANKVALLSTQLVQIKTDLDQARANLQQSKQDTIAVSEHDVDKVSAKLGDIRARRQDLEQSLVASTDKMQMFAALNAGSGPRAQGQMSVVKISNRLNALRQSEQNLEAKHQKLQTEFQSTQDLRLEVNALEHLYQSFLQRVKHAIAEQGLQPSSSRVLSYAVQGKPTGMAAPLILLLVGLGALFIGIYLNLVLYTARNRHPS